MSTPTPAKKETATGTKADATPKSGDDKNTDGKPQAPQEGWRETFESLAVALILALSFRTFVAEAFVIPTGSMAPTLMGRHRDVRCAKCNYEIRTGASVEERDGVRTNQEVLAVRCPQCAYENDLDPNKDWNQDSFAGDRIVVTKLAGEPKRWDVIVFKNPTAAQVNYIKRLIGLPNEHIKIEGGNIFVAPRESRAVKDADYKIARKPDDKLISMLQPVYESDYPCRELIDAGWPCRWQTPTSSESTTDRWKIAEDQKTFSTAATSDWCELRYRHFEPRPREKGPSDWETLLKDGKLADDVATWSGGLITDGYMYNSHLKGPRPKDDEERADLAKYIREYGSNFHSNIRNGEGDAYLGIHWVGDLAVECTAQVDGSSGAIAMDLVRGGAHYRCEIDVATGNAVMSIVDKDGNLLPFGDEEEPTKATAKTPVKGAGTYRLRLSNVDDEVRLWVNDRRITFDAPTTYPSNPAVIPQWSESDLGDLAPAGIAAKGVGLKVSHISLLRDKYYVAKVSGNSENTGEYRRLSIDGERIAEGDLALLMANPNSPDYRNLIPVLLASRGSWTATMEDDQFMPLGDNSPQSQDARYWFPEPFVPRRLLIGKALFVYWPHTWNNPMFWPDWRRMRPIH